MKQVVVLGGLLALALVGSYVTWTAPEDEVPAGDVVALRAEPSELVSLTWKDADKTIKLTHPSDERGGWFWVESVEKKKKAASKEEAEEALAELAEAAADEAPTPDAGADADAAATEVPMVEETTRFAASADAEGIWKAFTPLYALRELTLGADSDLKTYGLDAPTATLEVQLGGRTATVELGGEAYGTRDRYARIDGRVFLLEDEAIRPLQFATTRLVERRVHPFDEGEIAKVTVTQGTDEPRAFVQINADDRAKAFWASIEKPTDRDVEATTWLGKLFRMRVRSYEEIDPASLVAVFSFTVEGKDGATWSVDVRKTSAEPLEYWAIPQWTRTPVSLTKSLSEEAIADLPNLFDGVQPEAPPDVPRPGVLPVPGEPLPAGSPAALPSEAPAPMPVVMPSAPPAP